MIKLGLLVQLNEDGASVRYYVPNIVTTEDDDDNLFDFEVDEKDGQAPAPSPGTETFAIASSVGDKPYLPNGMIERVIAWLMPYALSYEIDNPSVSLTFPHLSEIKAKGKIVIILQIEDGKDKAFVYISTNGKAIVCSIKPLQGSDGSGWRRHAAHVATLASEINDEFFSGRLKMEPTRGITADKGNRKAPLLEIGYSKRE